MPTRDRTGGGWLPERPPIAFRYVTLFRVRLGRRSGRSASSVASLARGDGTGAASGGAANTAEAACGYVDKAKSVAPIATGATSAEAWIIYLIKSGSARQTVAATALAAERAACRPGDEITPDDTLTSRCSVPRTMRHGIGTKRTDHELQKPGRLTS